MRAMPANIRRAVTLALRTARPVPPLRLSEWAEQHFYLSRESSYVEQRWRAYPYQAAILDCMGNDAVEEVAVRKSARIGYTKMMLAAIAYFAEHKRRNQGVWQPTDEDSDEFVKTELEPMLRDVPAMQVVFPEFLQRHKHNTLRQKIFRGSMLHLRGGKAAKNYRRLSISVAHMDESDGFDRDIEGEGDPFVLMRKRIEGATFPKAIVGSTPKAKHFSVIDARDQAAEQRFRFLVPCPHCDTPHEIRWGGEDKPYGMKWRDRDPDTVGQLCPACGALYGQAEYLQAWARGRWVSQGGVWIDELGEFRDAAGERIPAPRSVSFFAWTAMSSQTSWSQIVREFLSAWAKHKTGDDTELKAFVNTTLGEAWEEELERAESSELAERGKTSAFAKRTVPLGVLVLVAGVDVQDNRFVVVVWGFGRGEEMWAVDHVVLEANPADERDWGKLDAYLQTRFRHASGCTLGLEAVAVDTGGHFTHQVYNFCRVRARRRVFAVKGETLEARAIKSRSSLQDVNYKGLVIKNGVKLWFVGTDTAKDLLFGRIKVREAGPGYVHFAADLGDDFYAELTAEARVKQKTGAGEKSRWVVTGAARNEVLDCTVYAMFCAHMLDLHRYTAKMWEKLEAAVQPPTADMFERAVEEPATAEASPAPTLVQTSAPAPRRRQARVGSGFVKGWRNGG